MHIHVTESARTRLLDLLDPSERKESIHPPSQSSRVAKLVYDNEGCGCAVNGVPRLQLVDSVSENDQLATINDERLRVYFNPLHSIYFEDRLKLDYNPEKNAFTLSSDQQIYAHDLNIHRS